jgi:hypothetical protein
MITEILNFENRLQGYRTRVKELHFSSKKHSIHVILDDFSNDLASYEDEVMEDAQAIHGQFTPGEISPVLPKSLDAESLLREIRADLVNMREFFQNESMYMGCQSETEAFFHTVNKTIYLIKLSLSE